MKFKPGNKVIYKKKDYMGRISLFGVTITRVWSLHRVLEPPTYHFRGKITEIIKHITEEKVYLTYEVESTLDTISFNNDPNILIKEVL